MGYAGVYGDADVVTVKALVPERQGCAFQPKSVGLKIDKLVVTCATKEIYFLNFS